MVPLRQVFHRVVEPIRLVFGRGADYAAAHDLLEQLVPSVREW
jgi:predicted DNA-binding transcriptional regulator YafY